LEKTRSRAWKPKWSSEEEQMVAEAAVAIKKNISAMRTLREAMGLSQAAFAKLMDTTQSNVSKMEASPNLRLSTLRKAIESRGGALTVVARIDDQVLEVPI
jgi:DNA-binding transcriptional regulator YiaG